MNGFSKLRLLWGFLRTVMPAPIEWLRTLIALALLMAVVLAGHSACYPWAYSISRGPTLTVAVG